MNSKNPLRRKMAEAGYNQAELAQKIGISRNTLSAKINGKRPFNTDEILDICNILGIMGNDEKINIFLHNKSPYRIRKEATS